MQYKPSQFFNKLWVKSTAFWILFWLTQSVLMSGGKYISFYLMKNIAIVGLQAGVIFLNIKFLFPNFFLKRRFILYILLSLLVIYLTFTISFFFIDIALSSWSLDSNSQGIFFSTDFWRILSGSSFYSLALVCSTIYQLWLVNRKLETSKKQQSENKSHTIQIKDGNTTHIVKIEDVLYIQGLREYVQWKTTDKKIISLQSLKSIEHEFKERGFVLVHKSYIVNTAKITSASNKELAIAEELIPIGKTYRNNLQL